MILVDVLHTDGLRKSILPVIEMIKMDKFHTAYRELSALRKKYKECMDNMYDQYCFLVNGILAGQIVSEQEIDAIMEGLLDFSDEERFLSLHTKLCWYVFEHYPNLIGNFKNIFRLQFSGMVGEIDREERKEENHN